MGVNFTLKQCSCDRERRVVRRVKEVPLISPSQLSCTLASRDVHPAQWNLFEMVHPMMCAAWGIHVCEIVRDDMGTLGVGGKGEPVRLT